MVKVTVFPPSFVTATLGDSLNFWSEVSWRGGGGGVVYDFLFLFSIPWLFPVFINCDRGGLLVRMISIWLQSGTEMGNKDDIKTREDHEFLQYTSEYYI